MFSGWLNALKAKTTPIGSCCVKARRPAEAALRFMGISLPACARKCSAHKRDAVDRPVDLDQRIGQGFAALGGGLQGKLLAALLHDGGRLAQDGDPLGRAEPGVAVLEQLVGRGQRTFHAAAVDLLDRGQPRAVERGTHLGVLRRGEAPGTISGKCSIMVSPSLKRC